MNDIDMDVRGGRKELLRVVNIIRKKGWDNQCIARDGSCTNCVLRKDWCGNMTRARRNDRVNNFTPEVKEFLIEAMTYLEVLN